MLLLLLVGCSSTNVDILPNEKGSLDVYFCQKDDCQGKLIDLIDEAKESVHCAFFDLDLKNVSKALAAKSHSADVKLVVDKDNDEGKIKGVRFDDSRHYMHNKFCIFDNSKVISGSFNPTLRGNFKNDNNIIIIESEYLAYNYEQEFRELWNGEFNGGNEVKFPTVFVDDVKIENYFCPEDSCSSHIIDVLDKAEESIYFMTFSFTHEKIADAILFKDVEIKGVFEKSQGGSKYSQFWRFDGFGLDVVKDKNSYNMHHKVFIIDSKIVVTGSFNPSNNADRNNDENILIIYSSDIAAKYLEEFERVYG